MPNIDVSQIEGFETMSPEEKVTALLGVEIPEAVDMSQYVEKRVLDAKASEAAALSKSVKDLKAKVESNERSKMTDAEKLEAAVQEARAQAAEENEALKQELEALKRDNAVTKISAKAATVGFDEKGAGEFANAVFDSDAEKIFTLLAARDKVRDKALEAQLLNQTKQPSGAGNKDGEGLDLQVARQFAKDYVTASGEKLVSVKEKWRNRN